MASYIPFGYLEDFLGHLDRHRARYEVLTYRDLDWDGDWDYAGGYPREKRAWQAALRSGRRDPRKIYLFLQHDVDSAPERTVEALRVEERLRLRSNVMIFNRRIDRRHLRETGELRYTEYIDDYAYLKSLEAQGFVIAYHCNAYERARFSRPEAARILREDVEQLGARFRLDFMSAHGGPAGPDGKSNPSLDLPRELRRRLRWVHNGYALSVDGGYSDGGINSGRRPPEAFDLRRFVQSLQPGRRYRVLIHPQYYAREVEANPRLKSPWYDEALEAYARAAGRELWDKMPLGAVPAARSWKQRVKRLIQRLRPQRNA
jgi:hypothetical protein